MSLVILEVWSLYLESLVELSESSRSFDGWTLRIGPWTEYGRTFMACYAESPDYEHGGIGFFEYRLTEGK